MEKQHVSGTRRELFLLSSKGGRSSTMSGIKKYLSSEKWTVLFIPKHPHRTKKRNEKFLCFGHKIFHKNAVSVGNFVGGRGTASRDCYSRR